MTIHTGESRPLNVLVLPVLLTLVEGARTPNDIARQTGLGVPKVNSILEELQSRRLIIETSPLHKDQFVEPRFRMADGEAVTALLSSEAAENPISYILSILNAVRYELPKAALQGSKVYAWYSRLLLTPEIAVRLINQLVQILAEYEELQKPDPATEGESPALRNNYRLSITFYQVGAEESHE